MNSNSGPKTSAQQQTFEQYHHLMQVNATSHLIRAARQVGVIEALREGQRTGGQLCQQLDLDPSSVSLFLDALVAVGIVEKYQDDFALSRAGHLLCQYDEDLGDARWGRLVGRLRGQESREGHDDQRHFDYLAATQWVHTPAAMQAAEILDIGGDVVGTRILDLGCGSAVWSCAMAYRDGRATITAVDNAVALEAATSTAESIGLLDRFEAIEATLGEDGLKGAKVADWAEGAEGAEPSEDKFDLVLLAQRISGISPSTAKELLEWSFQAAKSGGRVVVIDLFRGPTKPDLAEGLGALQLDLDTRGGQMWSLVEIQELLQQIGLQRVQFAFLSATKVNLGMAVGEKP